MKEVNHSIKMLYIVNRDHGLSSPRLEEMFL